MVSNPYQINLKLFLVQILTICVFITASCDVGFAIYSRYAAEGGAGPPVSYVAHLTGALAGLTIGLLVLKNFEQRLHEKLLWWVALGVYAACTLFAILYNIMGNQEPPVLPPMPQTLPGSDDIQLSQQKDFQGYGF